MRAPRLFRDITRIELFVAFIAGTIALTYLRWFLWFLSPDRTGDSLVIFSAFIIPVELFVLPSAISLVRSTSRDCRQLSPLGHFALGWPAISFPLFHPIYYIYVPFGIGLTLLAIASPRRKLPADFLPLAWNAAWFGLVTVFSVVIWSAFGD